MPGAVTSWKCHQRWKRPLEWRTFKREQRRRTRTSPSPATGPSGRRNCHRPRQAPLCARPLLAGWTMEAISTSSPGSWASQLATVGNRKLSWMEPRPPDPAGLFTGFSPALLKGRVAASHFHLAKASDRSTVTPLFSASSRPSGVGGWEFRSTSRRSLKETTSPQGGRAAGAEGRCPQPRLFIGSELF